jgi:ribosomal RNA assembly protein
MLELLNIPEERKAVLKIRDDIEIQGEPLDIARAKKIIRAIGRGFSPDRALKLLDDDFQLSVISLRGDSPKKMKRLLSRIIGRKGMAREKLEELTGCCISVYGKTVSIIGKWEEIEKAGRAVREILEGKPHSHVYKNLTRE